VARLVPGSEPVHRIRSQAVGFAGSTSIGSDRSVADIRILDVYGDLDDLDRRNAGTPNRHPDRPDDSQYILERDDPLSFHRCFDQLNLLSHDITSVQTQENRIRGSVNFRRELGELTDIDENPSDPSSFLQAMSHLISARAQRLTSEVAGLEENVIADVEEYVNSVSEATEQLGAVEETSGAEFAVLWKGIDFDYGSYIERSRTLSSSCDVSSESFDELIEAFELFAVGKEYFKSLYYAKEVSQLSQTLLIVALPAILFNTSAIIAINGGVLPDVTVLGLPSLQTFITVAFTILIAPYLVLTAYMLRLSTVAQLTASAGIFALK